MPSPDLRKSSTVLAIVTIVVHAANGFTLDRTTNAPSTEYNGDLATEESVQIKNVINPNDIRHNKDDSNKYIKNKERFSSDEKLNITLFSKNTSMDNVKNETDTPYANILGADVITNNYNDEPSTEGFVPYTTFDSQTVTGDNLAPTESTTSSNEYVTDADLSVSSINITNMNLSSTSEPSHIIKENISLSTIGSTRIEIEVNNITGQPNISDQIAIDTRSTNNLNDLSLLLSANSTIDNTNKVDLKKMNTQTPPTATIDAPESITKVLSTDTSKPEGGKLGSQESTEGISQKDLFLAEQKVVNALNQVMTEPTREELTTTDVLTLKEESISNEKQTTMIEEETRQTTLPIPSQEYLREELISNSNQLSTTRDPELSTATEAIPASELIGETQKETATVVSKRAGFLDLSKKSFAMDAESGAEHSTSRLAPRADAALQPRGTTNLTAYESRTLAEDAMREEEFIKFVDFTKQIEGDVSTNSQAEANTENGEHVIEDTLSVQPIVQDRRTTLYPAGPGSRPVKRLEPQPARARVRDPDDNSWRNESISSLGIVFKPKNSSSKSFKEVLKTKTEIELSNSQDKDSKGEAPELRERLEKITEVRKRKKKIDKFGAVVYTDYEEGTSAEGTSAPAAATGGSAAGTGGSAAGTGGSAAGSGGSAAGTGGSAAGTGPGSADSEGTAPVSTSTGSSYWANQLEKISKEDMHKELGLDVPTTGKPRKPVSPAEYYDTTDDYDVEYMTMPNFDIQKYTVSPQPGAALPTQAAPAPPRPASPRPAPRRPMQFPDRQPTLQYFPPTTRPPKVVLNEYDFDFENRIKAYTQGTPRPAPPTAAPPAAPAGDRLRMRPTVRPSDFIASAPPRHLVISSAGLERGSFVLRHLGEFLGRAAAREEDARAPDFPAFTAPPLPPRAPDFPAFTAPPLPPRAPDFPAFTAPPLPTRAPPPAPRDYDEPSYRRDVVDRFLDTFNSESERFNEEFPVLVNSSVVHGAEGAGAAASSAFMTRLLGGGGLGGGARGGCAAGACERLVELSPAYELHYFVPEQEERDAAEPGPERDRPAPYGDDS